MREPQISGRAGPLETAAILAAIARVVEEQLIIAAIPPERPQHSHWVMSGRPRPVEPPFTRAASVATGWSVSAPDTDEE